MFGILSALYTTVLWYSIQNCSIYTTLLEYYRCTWRKNQYLNKNHRHSTRKTHPRAKKQVILRLVPLFIWKSLTINYSDNFDRMPGHSAFAIRADKQGGYWTLTFRTFFKFVWGSGWGVKKQPVTGCHDDKLRFFTSWWPSDKIPQGLSRHKW